MELQVSHINVGEIKPSWLANKASEDIIVPPEARVLTPVTVLHAHGNLDGTSFEPLIEAGRSHIAQGAQRMIFELSNVPKASSAGLLGLYAVGFLLEKRTLESVDGYYLMGEMEIDLERGKHFVNICVAAPNEAVSHMLAAMHLDQIIPVRPSMASALDVFPE